MSAEVVNAAAGRIAEHVRAWGLPAVSVTFHGGEPLLAGVTLIEHTVTAVRAALPPGFPVRFTVQTNGVLLTEPVLESFLRHGVTVGVSLDGDEEANDRERRFPHGGGSYRRIRDGLAALRDTRFRDLFNGLLCTVDLRNDPIAVYEGLLRFQPPRIDLLLPHGNWSSPPPGRDSDVAHAPYADWLIKIFDRWYDTARQETDIRLFGAIMSLLMGGAGGSEVVGLEPVDFVIIETDGSVEQGDALKTTADGMAATGLHVDRNSFDDVLRHPAIRARQSGLAALGDTCRACDLVRVCGGGHYAHRYEAATGFANPTVYCQDQQRLIRHIGSRMAVDLRRLAASAAGDGDPSAGRATDRAPTGRAAGSIRQAGDRRSSRDGGDDRLSGVLPRHRLTGEQFDALAAGGGDTAALNVLRRSQLSKRLLLLREVRATGATSPDDRAAWAVLDASASRRTDVARQVLSRPFVDTWASRRLRPGHHPSTVGTVEADYLTGLAAVTAVLAGEPFELPVPPAAITLLLPGMGLLTVPDRSGGPLRLAFDGSALRLDVGRGVRIRLGLPDGDHPEGDQLPGGAGHWQPYRTVACGDGGHRVEVDDLDPYRTCFGLPATTRLDTTRAASLARLFADAWSFIDTHLPTYVPTVQTCLRSLVPVDAPGTGSVSASHQHAFGAIATSLPDDAPGLALLLVHETAHAKLSAVLDLVELVDPACSDVYHAPWRSDPRPAGALLQGAYAHTAVADFWRIHRRHLTGGAARAAQFEFDFWRRAAHRAADTLLVSPALTDLGRRFVTGLAGTLDGWSGEAVDPPVATAVSACATVSDIGWRLRNHRVDVVNLANLADDYRAGASCPVLPRAAIEPDGSGRPALAGGLARAIRTRTLDDARAHPPPVEELARLVGADPSDADAWARLALALAESGDHRAAGALAARPELVRGLLALVAPGDPGAAPRIARWLAAYPDRGSGSSESR